MLAFLSAAGTRFAASCLQLLVGCALAALLRRRAPERSAERADRAPRGGVLSGSPALVRGAAAACCGAALPLGVFGALPVAAAALAAGTGADSVLAFVVSNILFNALVPFTDPFFIWSTGYPRAILALAVGTGFALALDRSRDGGSSLVRGRSVPSSGSGGTGRGAAARRSWASFAYFVPFAAAGALAATAFRDYALGALMAFLFANPLTAGLPYLFAQADVTNALFLLATRILMTLTDLSSLAALAALLNYRGVAATYAYLALIAVLLGSTAFL